MRNEKCQSPIATGELRDLAMESNGLDAQGVPLRRVGLPQIDPLRAHGAWIYLFASVAAGALVGADYGVERPLLVGSGFAGAYLVMAALSTDPWRKRRQMAIGAGLAGLAPLVALWLDADPRFLWVAAASVIPGVAAVRMAKKRGLLSRATMVVGIAALVMVAPMSAVAGGAGFGRGAILFVLLWLFFCCQTLRVAASLTRGQPWDREQLRSQGLRQAAMAAVWTLTVALALRLTG